MGGAGVRTRTSWPHGVYRTGLVWAGLAVLAGPGAVRGGPPLAPVDPHRAVTRNEFGRGARSYWLFEPAEPRPERAPVVVLNHGWLAVNPGAYGAWIDHLVRSGNVVIFPRYQADALTMPADFLPNALNAVSDALDVLELAKGHVRPDRDRFALVVHSAGGNLAAQMAAMAAEARLPKPRAVVALMPGEVQASREPDLSAIPAETLLVVTVAEDDFVVGDLRAREIFAQARAIPPSRKKFVFYRSDLHGIPRLVADHLAPTGAYSLFDSGDGMFRSFQMNQAEVNALDRAGFWQLTDLTLQAAFAGRTLDEATDHGERFRHLGYWSDGRPVTRPIVGDDLARMPRVVPFNGVRLIPWPPDRLFGPFVEPDAPPVAESSPPTRRR